MSSLFHRDSESPLAVRLPTAPVARWSVWEADPSAAALPDVGFVEPLLRRRLSLLVKMVLRVAHECAGMPILLAAEERRIGSVMSNSFGFGGTNACLIFHRMS